MSLILVTCPSACALLWECVNPMRTAALSCCRPLAKRCSSSIPLCATEAHQAERYERYQQVVALHKQGMKTKEIAKRVGLGVRTIQRWLSEGAYVETNYHHRHRSRFDAYEAYVKQRWDEGCHNIQQLWREIKAQGYPHSDRALRAHLEPLRGKEKADFPEASCLDHFWAKKARWLFIRRITDL